MASFMIDKSYKRDTTHIPCSRYIVVTGPNFKCFSWHNNLSCHLLVKPISHYVADEPWSSLVLCLFWYQLRRHETSCDWLPLVATQIYHSWVTVGTPRKQPIVSTIWGMSTTTTQHFMVGNTQILPFINFACMHGQVQTPGTSTSSGLFALKIGN